jgi:hypothetical protein
MKTAARRSPGDRDRAIARLRALTIGPGRRSPNGHQLESRPRVTSGPSVAPIAQALEGSGVVMKSSALPADRVTLSKETIAETGGMFHDPRAHIRRRRYAIDRLRSLTTGAAIAGLAGTAGFGLLAATSWSGTASAAVTAGGSTTSDGTSGYGTSGSEGTSGTDPIQVAPQTGQSGQQPTSTTRVQRGSGSGHAATGGSH